MAGTEPKTHLCADNASLLAKITQSPLQMRGVTSRWLLKMLPWVDVKASRYQVNRSEDIRFESSSKKQFREWPKIFAANSKFELHNDFLDKLQQNNLDIHTKPSELLWSPRQYGLTVVRSVLRLEIKAIDLYHSFAVTEQQMYLTIEQLRERQENRILNHPKFGLLHNVHPSQQLEASTKRSILDTLDDLLSMRRDTQFLFAHPRTIAAFGHECSNRGLIIQNISLDNSLVPSWRGIPLLNCSKIPINENTSSIIAVRTGEANEGVIGLRPASLPDQVESGINIRLMGITSTERDEFDQDDDDIISYLVSNYFSVAVLKPSALGIIKNIKVPTFPYSEH